MRIFIYLSIHYFLLIQTSIFLYNGLTKIVNASKLTEPSTWLDLLTFAKAGYL